MRARPQREGAGWLPHAVALAALLPLASVLWGAGASSPIPARARFLAALLWALCLWPGWAYVRWPSPLRPRIPFFPFVGVLYGLYYALPVALGVIGLNYSTWLLPEVHYDPAVEAALTGWVLILTSYALARRLIRVPGFGFKELPPEILAPRAAVLVVTGVLLDVLSHAAEVPLVFAGLIHFLGMVGMMGLLLLIMLWGKGRLPVRYRVLALLGGSLLVLGDIGTGSAAPIAWSVLMLGTAAWAARGRVSGLAAALVVVGMCLMLLVKGVLGDFRTLVWFGSQEIGPLERVEVMSTLVADRIEEEGLGAAVTSGFERASERSGIAELLADVIRRTPSEIPYWNGETYLSLVGTFVPRFLWPDKPVKNLGQSFGHRYLYLHAQDEITAYNLPWLVEFYANFGWAGLFFGPLIVGLTYRVADGLFNSPGQSAMMTAVGIVLLVPLCHIESDFSLVFGGLFLQGTAAVGTAWLMGRSARPRAVATVRFSRRPGRAVLTPGSA